jgi:sugar O-acyltransferase (sialic acid O-acetyltransferase NeuD family)
MLIYGAGGHAKVIISILHANGRKISGIYDDDSSKQELCGISIIGNYNALNFPDEKLIIAIGNNVLRRKIFELIRHDFESTIHPTALIDQTVMVGAGTCIMHNAVIQADAKIGDHAIVNTGASIDHDCDIGHFVHLAPGTLLAGNVKIGENSFIGIGSIVAPGITIGRNCLIAAGSVVTIDIPDGSVVRGNPARILSRQL